MDSPNCNSVQSKAQSWFSVWMLCALIAVVIVCAAEWHWRDLGYKPHLRDSAQLWSIQRDRVYTTTSTPLVLLGASHIEYSIDMKRLDQLLPDYRPVMLAYNGHYPLAALRDLAHDEAFRGVVLCDIDARGLSDYYDAAQQPFVDYYHHQWSPSWHLHRLLLSDWQRVAISGSPQFSIVAAALRWLANGPPPWRTPLRFHTDRSGDIDFSQADGAALMRGFATGFREDLSEHPPKLPTTWLAELQRVRQWCDTIRSRGGEVIFLRTPTSGALLAAEDEAFPRAKYWDQLAAAVKSPTFYATDDAYFATLHLGDGSHVDYHQKAAYTRALVDALAARGLLQH